jgi:hypothetical protein
MICGDDDGGEDTVMETMTMVEMKLVKWRRGKSRDAVERRGERKIMGEYNNGEGGEWMRAGEEGEAAWGG